MDKLISIFTDVGTELAKASVNKAIEEASYLCCYQSYVDDFDDQRKKLSDVAGSVREDIKDARDRNETRIDPIVQGWLDEADGLIQQDTTSTSKKKWFFNLCPNCIWQNRRSKELKDNTQVIKDLITGRSNLPPVARPAEIVGIEFYTSPDFMHFESREMKFEQLKEALKDVKNCMMGLYGMGGTGKTTMVKQVGAEFKELKVFDKVIVSVVSNANQPADVIRIRGDIAKHLGLRLEEGRESQHADKLSTRIAEGKEKILIILDDVWDKELNLKAIGIPYGQHQEGRCSVLITARNVRVCREMGCQKAIQLETLSMNDALNLFLFHSGKSGDHDSSNTDFKEVASNIVNQCGRLPAAIVPLARALQTEPLEYWNDTLIRLQNFDPMSHEVHEDLTDAYKSLSLSYETLKDPKAQKLLHLCSLFPEDFEIPVELLTRIAIGMGLCAKADKYRVARSQVSALQHKLLDSCLLFIDVVKRGFLCSGALHMVTEKCVKMHDLTREVAHLIAKEEIQEVTGSKSTLTENIKCLSWNKNGFPDRFDGGELEFLLVIINAEGEVQVPNALFEGMKKLRVLILFCGDGRRYSMPSVRSLLNSTHTLKYLQTLLLKHWELGDIQVIGSLENLETLELIGCYITKLPDEVAKLKKLRLLSLINCTIDTGNPFKVIERCPILEELYYIQNFGERYSTEELGHIEAPTTLESYHIIGNDTTDADLEVGNSVIRRCFRPDQLCKIFCEATIKSLSTRAEILQLKDDGGRWTNVIPEIDPTEGMKDLIKLSLESCPNMKSLIHLDHRHSDVTIFSKLVQLELVSLGLRELFDGPLPTKLKETLFKKLEVLCMKGCPGLEGTLFKEELDLGNLKSIELFNCSITFLFLPSTAWSLKQLEKLVIIGCEQLKYIIVDEGSEERNVDVQNQKGHDGSNFKLKILQVDHCPKLEFLYPVYFAEVIQQLEEVKIASCKELKYIFGQYPNEEGSYQIQKHVILPSLKLVHIHFATSFIGMFPAECCHPISPVTTTQDGLKVEVRDPASPTFTLSRNLFCCFCPKSSDVDHVISKETLPDQTGLQILKTKRDFTLDSCLMRRPLSTSYITKMEIFSCSSLTSLFTLHVASSMSLLEKLDVYECHGLKQIVTDEGDGHEHMNYNSIFPKLRKMVIYDCDHLENVFPASHFMIDHLEVITIEAVPKLRYVFGKSNLQDIVPHQNQNVEILLPALKKINLSYAPDMVNICIENFHTTALSLESITVEKCPQLCISPFIDFGGSRLEDHTTRKAVEIQPEKYSELSLENLKTDKIYDLERHQIKGPARSGLEKLRIEELPMLTDICVGMKNSLSLHNLSSLSIHQCKKLKFIFSASILRSLPKLTHLEAFECKELLQIIEETEEYGLVSNHNCFPELRIISVKKCNKLKCLFSIFACGILPKLEELSIEEAPELVQVIGCKQCETKEKTDVFPRLSDEGDGHHHMNCNSIFPELRRISILNCDHLENAFPASHCTKLDHLEDITVHGVPKLRYVFGKCSCQDIVPHQNQNAEILLPVLKDIKIYAAPNMVNIWMENVHTTALSLENIIVSKCPELCISPFIDFGGGRLETQQENLSSRKAVEIQPEKFIKLFLSDVKTDKIYDLERLQIKGPAARSGLKELEIFDLPMLTDICVGIENILSLHNLSSLTIFRCKKLQFIFSASILQSLPKLKEIMVVECE